MGCGMSLRERADALYELRKYSGALRALQLTKSEAIDLFLFFRRMDADHSGQVSLMEFFDFVELKRTKFAKRAFSLVRRPARWFF